MGAPQPDWGPSRVDAMIVIPKRKQPREQIDEFLDAFEAQAKDIVSISLRAQKEASKHSYQMYNDFRTKVSEFDTFTIIISSKLKTVDTRRFDEVNEKFETIQLMIMNHLIKTSIKFFFVLSMATTLPLGAREIFVEELRRIHDTKNKLEDPRFADKIDQEGRDNLDIAEEILNEIIDKAPSLLNFGQGQSTLI